MLPEDPILLPEIIDHVFLVAVHPASGREYEEAQSVGHSLRLLREQPLAPTLFRRFASRGRFVAPYAVDLGDSTSTVLTIRADEDESLADNQTRTATVTIVDAGGADIGDRDTLTVTVRGSTAVPALPLVAQLLLALLLMAVGGATGISRAQSRTEAAPIQ